MGANVNSREYAYMKKARYLATFWCAYRKRAQVKTLCKKLKIFTHMGESFLRRLHPFGWKSCTLLPIFHKKIPTFKHFFLVKKWVRSDRQMGASRCPMGANSGESGARKNKPIVYAINLCAMPCGRLYTHQDNPFYLPMRRKPGQKWVKIISRKNAHFSMFSDLEWVKPVQIKSNEWKSFFRLYTHFKMNTQKT